MGKETNPFFAATPTLRIDGQEQTLLASGLLQSIIAEETTLGLFRCEARFLNWGQTDNAPDYLLFDGKVVDFGKSFSVEFRNAASSAVVFNGRMMAMEASYRQQSPPELTVLAEDRFQDLRMERRTRSFENVTDADVCRRIASQHGMTAQTDLESSPNYKTLAQVNQSDLAFLRERAAAVDAHLWIEDKTIHLQSRARRKTSEVTLELQGGLLEFQVLADLAHQRSSVKVCGWDIAAKNPIEVEATESSLGSEKEGLKTGSSILERALSARHERMAMTVPLSRDEAEAVAKARYKERARRFVTGTGLASGEPKLRVGTLLTLPGLGKPFAGKYFVTRTRHTFDTIYGYRTEFDVERAGIGS